MIKSVTFSPIKDDWVCTIDTTFGMSVLHMAPTQELAYEGAYADYEGVAEQIKSDGRLNGGRENCNK